jgi:hypothetical protein
VGKRIIFKEVKDIKVDVFKAVIMKNAVLWDVAPGGYGKH